MSNLEDAQERAIRRASRGFNARNRIPTSTPSTGPNTTKKEIPVADHTQLINNLKSLVVNAENDTLDRHDVRDILNETIELLESSDVRPKAKPRGEQPEPAVGQVWRNRTSGRLVKIVQMRGTGDRFIRWEALTGRGQKEGVRVTSAWSGAYDHVETPEEGSTDEH